MRSTKNYVVCIDEIRSSLETWKWFWANFLQNFGFPYLQVCSCEWAGEECSGNSQIENCRNTLLSIIDWATSNLVFSFDFRLRICVCPAFFLTLVAVFLFSTHQIKLVVFHFLHLKVIDPLRFSLTALSLRLSYSSIISRFRKLQGFRFRRTSND